MNKIISSLIAVSFLSSCGMNNSALKPALVRHENVRKELTDKMFSNDVVTHHASPYGGVKKVSETELDGLDRSWLRSIHVTLTTKEPVSAKELVRMLSAKGINITSATPLEKHTYTGFGVTNVDGETALNLLLGAMGLDYQIDNVGKFVTITPVGSRTFYLNLGNRQTAFAGGMQSNQNGTASGTGSSMNNGQNGSQQGLGATGSTGVNGTGGAFGSSTGGFSGNSGSGGISGTGMSTTGTGMGGSGSGMGTSTGSNGSSGAQMGGYIAASDQFWTSLRNEIAGRLKVVVPNQLGSLEGYAPLMPDLPNAPQLGGRMPPELAGLNLPANNGNAGLSPVLQSQAMSTGFYAEQQFGNFSVNPETGAVTIRAPRWMLDGFADYFRHVEEQYNTVFEFTGEIVHLTSNIEDLQGLDVAAFASFAHGTFGAVITNNALGGVTVSGLTPAATAAAASGSAATVATAAQAISAAAGSAFPAAVPYVGIVSAANKLQIFNAFLSYVGDVDIVQKPSIVTDNGIPGEFRKMERTYWNNLQQTAASGGVAGAQQATQNNWMPVDTGIDLRIYPHYDVERGLIRAQITLQQALQTGTLNGQQTVSTGTSTEQIPVNIPIITNQQYSGETLLRDGDLVIVGGQIDDAKDVQHSGITGLMDLSGIGPIFGRKDTKKQKSTYYFALEVHVRKRVG